MRYHLLYINNQIPKDKSISFSNEKNIDTNTNMLKINTNIGTDHTTDSLGDMDVAIEI